MNKLACVAIVAVLVADGSAFAGALDQKQQTALNNLQAEVLRCSSFHLISQMGFEQSKIPAGKRLQHKQARTPLYSMATQSKSET